MSFFDNQVPLRGIVFSAVFVAGCYYEGIFDDIKNYQSGRKSVPVLFNTIIVLVGSTVITDLICGIK